MVRKSYVNQKFIPYSRPSIGKEEIEEVINSLESGWLTTGPKVQIFEEKLKDYFETPFAITVSSATAGLYLSMKAMNFKEGQEVITTAFTFVSTINTIVQNGLKPVFVDINLETYNLCEKSIVEKISKKTVAIIPVHFAGQPVNLDIIYELAQKYNLRVIEDAAHSFGSQYKGKRIGSFGDVQVFSFQATKNITTGEGGCIIVREQELAEKLMKLRFHGIDRDGWKRYSKKGNILYDVTLLGGKFNMMDLQAAIGIHQIDKIEKINARRQKLAKRYLIELKDLSGIVLPSPVIYKAKNSWHLFCIRINTNLNREKLIEYMKNRNIGVGIHYTSVYNFSYYKRNYPNVKELLPNTQLASESILSLPLYPSLTFKEQDHIIKTLKSFF